MFFSESEMGQGTLRGRGGRLVRGSDAVQGSALCPHWGRAAPSKDHVQGLYNSLYTCLCNYSC